MGRMAPTRKKHQHISPSVLEMNFMKSAKIRIEETNAKRHRQIQEVCLRVVAQTKPREDGAVECVSDDASTSELGWEREDSYVKLMNLREFGRFSFNGFNPEVEKEMKFWDAKHNGIPVEDLDDDKDISDEEMASTAFGQKRFKETKSSNEEKLLDFSYIEEATGPIRKFPSNKSKNQYNRKRKSMPAHFNEEDAAKRSRNSDH